MLHRKKSFPKKQVGNIEPIGHLEEEKLNKAKAIQWISLLKITNLTNYSSRKNDVGQETGWYSLLLYLDRGRKKYWSNWADKDHSIDVHWCISLNESPGIGWLSFLLYLAHGNKETLNQWDKFLHKKNRFTMKQVGTLYWYTETMEIKKNFWTKWTFRSRET